MSAELQPQTVVAELTENQQQAITVACESIAPTWPLDQMIAVNPWWELRHQPFHDVSAKLMALGKIHCLQSKNEFGKLWLKQIQPQHLLQAAAQLGCETSVDDLLEHLEAPEWQTHWHNLSDWLDSERDNSQRMAWRDEITHQISQFCAGYFQPGSPFNKDAQAEKGLYVDWLESTRQDRGIEIVMGEPGLSAQFERLPDDYSSLLAEAFSELEVNHDQLANYLHALLLDINGWASWVAYKRWQAKLNGIENHSLMSELLAIRLSWELVLWRHHFNEHNREMHYLRSQWHHQWHRLPRIISTHQKAQQLSWVWQLAAELSYQQSVEQQLLTVATDSERLATPQLQAVFCIDVRSEPMRRALESQHPDIQTLGFAGFFGLPLEYQPQATALTRPQLPGLLKPAIHVCDAGSDQRRAEALNKTARWQAANDAPPASFSLVEAAGLSYAYKLFKETFLSPLHEHPVNDLGCSGQWQLTQNAVPLSDEQKADLVAGILNAMGLTGNYASRVLLVGHGSVSRNNPHAAGLDCGACGGQTGEINVRVLASLLNDKAVREQLLAKGIEIPASTQFIAALHNTTTDEIECFEYGNDTQLAQWLTQAGEVARGERAHKLGLTPCDTPPGGWLSAFAKRSSDWSQVRPEWGLANNACFIVAPRGATKALNFAGRSFLHDYDWKGDNDFSVLELIMTAPMIVTNWINMQYNASVTDNLKYGSGNKVLHNVVGGNLGVFEGNGGDLRIGLSMQSLHDGSEWVHQPLRLSVYIDAPRSAISDIAQRHSNVSALINNDWLYLFQWDSEQQQIARYYQGHWHEHH